MSYVIVNKVIRPPIIANVLCEHLHGYENSFDCMFTALREKYDCAVLLRQPKFHWTTTPLILRPSKTRHDVLDGGKLLS
jgi:hypothetical protein